jgi:4,5-DOPA dioxygenase extradiol
MTSTAATLPSLFLGHGSPMNALTRNRWSEAWRGIGQRLRRPEAILCVSAHWLTRGTGVTAMSAPRTIHDFGGFPRELFEMEYPAPGSPALAARVREALQPVDVALDQAWGLDHGTWSVLAHVFPAADIPVVQLSMDGTKPAQFHYDLARRLQPLREEGVLIIGSGNVVHNLRAMRFDDAAPYPWATGFDDAVKAALIAGDHSALIDYERLTEEAALAVPTSEHYLPLLYVIGQQRAGDPVSFPVEGIDIASMSMRSVAIGEIAG